jgi:spoIIIJ-associated protein
MDWVTTTGRTVDEAKEAALDELGIDESDAEFEVLQEPKSGLFKRSKVDAKVRARVMPKAPRPKQERRPRRARGKSDDATSTPEATAAAAEPKPAKPARAPKAAKNPTPADDADISTTEADAPVADATVTAGSEGTSAPRRRNRSRSRGGSSAGGDTANATQETKAMTDDVVNVDQQADIINEFLEGLLAAIDVPGDITRTKVDDDTVELSVTGSGDLGLLIGPKGQTLTAVHELSRTVLQRQATGRHDGRVRIDIGGYRQRRAEALARFVTTQADAVRAEGVSRALEPMNAVDRKIVHDTVNDLDGVSTVSEGMDPNRRVVIVPDGASE